jgi:hypothetical protein
VGCWPDGQSAALRSANQNRAAHPEGMFERLFENRITDWDFGLDAIAARIPIQNPQSKIQNWLGALLALLIQFRDQHIGLFPGIAGCIGGILGDLAVFILGDVLDFFLGLFQMIQHIPGAIAR